MKKVTHINSGMHLYTSIHKMLDGGGLGAAPKLENSKIGFNLQLLKSPINAQLPNEPVATFPPLCIANVHGRKEAGECLVMPNTKPLCYYLNVLYAFIIFFTLAPRVSIAQNAQKLRVDSLKNQLPKYKNDTNKVMLFNKLSAAYKGINPNEGINYGNLGLALAEKLKWPTGIAYACNSIGQNYYAKSEYASALDYYKKALAIREIEGKLADQASVIGNLSLVYLAKGDYAKALDANFKALKICEALNNNDSRATIIGNIGAIYMSLGNYDQSLKYHQMSVDLFEKLGNQIGAASNLGNIGNVYQAMGNYAKAIEYNFKSLDYFKKMGDNEAIATCLLNIGNIYHSMGDFSTALDFDFKSLALFKVQGDKGGEAIDYGNIGEDYLALAQSNLPLKKNDSLIPSTKIGVINKSVEYLNKGIVLSRANSQLDNIREFSKSLSEAYKLVLYLIHTLCPEGGDRLCKENHLQALL